MKIEYVKGKWHYYDICGDEIHDGDFVLMNNRRERVYLTEDGELGVDATNPVWIEQGRASPTEYGIYPFSRWDEPLLVP